ncbi:hypothetical protein CLOM_g1430 [Closterium sp. NIES-68]|nr:hypothetical protein CLOM_g1430 [Closterium sp. NIES-68]GJP68923.1 hypothetical protein CLOP_g25564 [Closterium sp. NIES-67]
MLTVHAPHPSSSFEDKGCGMGCFCFGSSADKEPPVKAEEIKEEVESVVSEEPEEQIVYAGVQDRAIWNCPGGRHISGDFSMAVCQANTILEDFSIVQSGKFGTFVGVFDGHGGAQAASFLNDNMYSILDRATGEAGGPSEESFRKAFEDAEAQFLEVVRENWKMKPIFAAAGSCALVGLVQSSTLYIASVGDSRAVVGSLDPDGDGTSLRAEEVSEEHSASCEKTRQEVKEMIQGDDNILVEKGGVWRVKGIIQVTRSIGDFYLKHQEFQNNPLYTRFRLPEPLTTPALICQPSLLVKPLTAKDRFVVFGSDGLWENVSNEETVEIVSKFPRLGIARRLVKLAMIRAARKRKLTYGDLKRLGPGRRRQVHDDISVVVLFLDSAVGKGKKKPIADITVKSYQTLTPRPEDGSVPEEEEVPDDFKFGADDSSAADGDGVDGTPAAES